MLRRPDSIPTGDTIIKDPVLEPFFISKSQSSGYTVYERVTKGENNTEYIKTICYPGNFNYASKSIANEKAYNQIFNITYGEGREILKLIEIIKNNFSNIEVEFKERSKLVPVRGTLSNSKSKDLLDYKSEWPLEKGYQQYINWYKDFFDKKINVS